MVNYSLEAVEIIREKYPKLYRALCPRKIVPPAGYASPKQSVLGLFSGLHAWQDPALRGTAHVGLYLNTLVQMRYGVPTYYMGLEFSQALVHTGPPEDLRLQDIHVPLPAMMLMLHDGFSRYYFGWRVPYICISWVNEGLYPDCLTGLPSTEIRYAELDKLTVIKNKLVVCAPFIVYEGDLPVFYTTVCNTDMVISDMDHIPFEDETYYEEQILQERYGNIKADLKSLNALQSGNDEELLKKLGALAVKILTALGAIPLEQIVIKESLLRPQRLKKGKRVQEELWSPNLLGWNYKVPREKSEIRDGRGTHASPRMHWRRGHFRNQPHGPKPWTAESPKKLIWIEPVLVNKPN